MAPDAARTAHDLADVFDLNVLYLTLGRDLALIAPDAAAHDLGIDAGSASHFARLSATEIARLAGTGIGCFKPHWQPGAADPQATVGRRWPAVRDLVLHCLVQARGLFTVDPDRAALVLGVDAATGTRLIACPAIELDRWSRATVRLKPRITPTLWRDFRALSDPQLRMRAQLIATEDLHVHTA